MDHMVPGFNGIETTAAIRSLEGDYSHTLLLRELNTALKHENINTVSDQILMTEFKDATKTINQLLKSVKE
jgi:uncharacterized protein YqgV (UPF0045/DUF77 family)